jgi:hypothetical protein
MFGYGVKEREYQEIVKCLCWQNKSPSHKLKLLEEIA